MKNIKQKLISLFKNLSLLSLAGVVCAGIGAGVYHYAFAQVEYVQVEKEVVKESTQDIVYRVAREEGIDWLMTVRIIDCESRWDKYFSATMKTGSKDMGLLAFNSASYPELSKDCIYDPECAVRTFAKEVKAGRLKNWLCARTLGYVK